MDNEGAIAFYQDLGFERVGRRRGYYRDGIGRPDPLPGPLIRLGAAHSLEPRPGAILAAQRMLIQSSHHGRPLPRGARSVRVQEPVRR